MGQCEGGWTAAILCQGCRCRAFARYPCLSQASLMPPARRLVFWARPRFARITSIGISMAAFNHPFLIKRSIAAIYRITTEIAEETSNHCASRRAIWCNLISMVHRSSEKDASGNGKRRQLMICRMPIEIYTKTVIRSNRFGFATQLCGKILRISDHQLTSIFITKTISSYRSAFRERGKADGGFHYCNSSCNRGAEYAAIF